MTTPAKWDDANPWHALFNVDSECRCAGCGRCAGTDDLYEHYKTTGRRDHPESFYRYCVRAAERVATLGWELEGIYPYCSECVAKRRATPSMIFGECDPRQMPPHFFGGGSRLDYESSLKADISNQNYTVCPRYWYIDATVSCPRCGNEFCFTAGEQKFWYEVLKFYVDSTVKHCLACRQTLRDLKHRRNEYDKLITAALQGNDSELKQRVADLIDELCEAGGELPEKMLANRRLLAIQLCKDE